MHLTTLRRRPAFTLIELLLVIAIIAILSAATIPMAMSAINSQRKARTTGAIKALASGCDAFRKLYGDFPNARSGASASSQTNAFRQDLFAQLNGTKVLLITATATGSTTELVNHNDSRLSNGAKRVVRPILDQTAVPASDGTGNENVTAALKTEFIDAWGNAFDYRYKIAGSGFNPWLSPDFLLVSCGVDFVESTDTALPHIPAIKEYWDTDATPSMLTEGTIPPTYFDSGEGFNRSDNITNWSGR